MKKILAVILPVCLCFALIACNNKPSDAALREALNVLVSEDATEQLQAASYYRVAIDTLEKDGKNQWKAEGNVSYTDGNGYTVAVLYTTTLRYDKSKDTFSTETVFGDAYRL